MKHILKDATLLDNEAATIQLHHFVDFLANNQQVCKREVTKQQSLFLMEALIFAALTHTSA